MILVEQMGDKFRVSDLAQANEYLFLHGLDIKPETKAEYYYNDVVKRFGINSKDDELFVEVEEKNITEAINKILTAVNSIDHIIYTQSPRDSPNFQDMVSKWLTEERINFKQKIEIYRGVTEPPDVTDNDSIIRELKDDHGIMSVVLRCPCSCDANSATGHPNPVCPYCYGDGKIQYGIDEVEFI